MKTKLIHLVSESIRHILFLTTDTLCLFCRPQNRSNSKKRVLIVKPDAIGDFVLWLDSAKELRKLFPSDTYEIILLGNSTWVSIAGKMSYFDEVWSLDRHKFICNPVYRCQVLTKIRQAGFDRVVHFIYSREFLYGDAIVRVSGAKNRVGFQGDCSNIGRWLKHFSDRWYTQLVPAGKHSHAELERNAEFVRELGVLDFNVSIPELPSIAPKPVGMNAKDYYILVPGAGFSGKRWPLDRFSAIANRIYKTTGWTGIICGAATEEELGRELVLNNNIPLQNISGLTSLEELITYISGARILISNDTSAVHIAAAVSIPSVCILGGGHFGRFLPYPVGIETNKPKPVPVFRKMDCYNCNWKCNYYINSNDVFPCIKDVSVDSVWNAVKKILDMKYQEKS